MDVGGVGGGLVAALGGVGATWMGWATWRGRELRWVGEALRDPDGRRGLPLGGRTLYQTYFGSAAGFVVGGPSVALIGLGLTARSLVDPDTEPWWWWAVSLVGMTGVLAAVLYGMAYFWTGVPDGLRPPAQRGQPKIGALDDEGRAHPFTRLLATPGPVDLGPDPTRPPWARLDPEWTGYRPPRRSVDERW